MEYIKKFINKNWKALLLPLVIILLLEITVFNINSYRLLFGDYEFKKVSVEDMKFDGITYLENEDIYITYEEEPYIEIENINTEIATIYFDIEYGNIPIQVLYTDENSINYRLFPSKEIIASLENSKYITTYISGKTEKIRINFLSQLDIEAFGVDYEAYEFENDHNIFSFKINSIEFNKQVPFQFNIMRVLILYSIFLFIFISLKVCKAPYDKENKNYSLQKIILYIILFSFGFLMLFINYCHTFDYDVYNKEYVDAILNGTFVLNIEGSDVLKQMENPYDATLRTEILFKNNNDKIGEIKSLLKEYDFETNTEERKKIEKRISEVFVEKDEELFLGDMVWYNNQYYVYFGILPLLLFYLPFKVITGMYLPHMVVILITGIITIEYLHKIIVLIYEKYFKNIPFRFLIYGLVILLFGSLLLILSARQLVYEICVSTGIMFSVIALYNILKISDENILIKNDYKHIFISSLCLALTVACRPNYLLFSILLVPVIYNKILKNIKLISRKNLIKIFLLISIPYIIVGSSLMYMNYVRFGSITEFGYSYQLTVNDNSNIHYRYMMLPNIFFRYLFDVPKFIDIFPFYELKNNEDLSIYMYSFYVNQYGGVFFMAPICLLLFGIKTMKKENKKLKTILYSLILVALLTILVLSYTAGIVIRYYVDFMWLLVIASIIIMFSIYNNLETDKEKSLYSKTILIITIVTVLSGIVVQAINGESFTLEMYFPELYNFIKYSICFWK